MIVAIDGPAGSGKSTTARRVAEEVGYLYLDTGALYRAVALAFVRRDQEPTAKTAAQVLPQVQLTVRHEADRMRVALNGEDVTSALRTPTVSRLASEVSGLPAVREKLLGVQRRIARRCSEDSGSGVVLDGRDIGTVVFPEADLKIFMVADPEVRARRRLRDLEGEGAATSFDEVLAEIRKRDRKDRERDIAPLRRADDALELDTTNRTIDEQVEFVVQQIRERRDVR